METTTKVLKKPSEPKETWKTIIIFLIVVTITSAIFHYAIVNLYPSSIYIGGLMWCPAIAAFVTLKWMGRSISTLGLEKLEIYSPILFYPNLVCYDHLYPHLGLWIGRVNR